jgi:hypothetical protein
VSKRAHGQIRRSQVITTWGPGALIDLPRHAGIVAGLDSWPRVDALEEIVDLRLTRVVSLLTGVDAPRLYAPPADSGAPNEPRRGIGVWRFPQWMLVQEDGDSDGRGRARRLVHRRHLDDRGRFDGRQVVPTRFVRACPRGHVGDIDWYRFVHGPDNDCRRQLSLHEQGASGDLADLRVGCECGASRGMHEAADLALGALGRCSGDRPWLGASSRESCGRPSRLLIRTASNAYFPLVLGALSLPERGTELEADIRELWDDLQIVEAAHELALLRRKPNVAAKLAAHGDEEILEAIDKLRHGRGEERRVKLVELDALLAQPEGYGDDVPIDPDFHARRLPEQLWRSAPLTDRISSVIQLHRLREVQALIGFTRFEALTPDVNGEYDTDVEPAALALDPRWFPAVENRGEGVFIGLDGKAVEAWLARPAVVRRLDELRAGYVRWATRRKVRREFPGGPYVLLHTLSHLLLQSVAMRAGYPASSIRERVYADYEEGRYGVLLYTASTDAEGTLGGLVSQARHIGSHLQLALRAGGLCSNDPVCAQRSPGEGMEGRWLHGAACHGCTLIAETSCEMRNDLLDRALVVPTLAVADAAFFPAVP